jgi:hypothetical protein
MHVAFFRLKLRADSYTCARAHVLPKSLARFCTRVHPRMRRVEFVYASGNVLISQRDVTSLPSASLNPRFVRSSARCRCPFDDSRSNTASVFAGNPCPRTGCPPPTSPPPFHPAIPVSGARSRPRGVRTRFFVRGLAIRTRGRRQETPDRRDMNKRSTARPHPPPSPPASVLTRLLVSPILSAVLTRPLSDIEPARAVIKALNAAADCFPIFVPLAEYARHTR